jgi:AraC-like DNA-binding protein
LYPYFDGLLVLSGLLAFPLYHIYFRLLTLDGKFSFKKHHRYLIAPMAVFMVYSVAVLMTPWEEYKGWLFKEITHEASPRLHILDFLRKIIVVTFVVQLFLSIIGNHRLITKYGQKAEQYYSNIRDGKDRYSKMLNYSILAMSMASLLAILAGRFWLMSKDGVIYMVWGVFSVSLYVMGYLGLNQKIINPADDTAIDEEVLQPSVDISDPEHKKLLEKIHRELAINKIYLNNNLIIMDLVKIVGTNRSYISAAINQQYNQNFCSFINTYRIEELKCLLVEKPDYRNIDLAEECGFGSVISMKRAVTAKTGLQFPDFKEHILGERRKEANNIGLN